MRLKDIWDLIDSFGIAESIYIGKLADKDRKAIGIYNSKFQRRYRIGVGGHENESYEELPVTFLVHWTDSFVETEEAAEALFDRLEAVRETDAGESHIKFVQLPYHVQDVGTDENGIFERVIEAVFIIEKTGQVSGEEGE